MKVFAFALAVICAVGSISHAQMGGMGGGWPPVAIAPEDRVKLDLLELEQEVDKSLLREALTNLGKATMANPKADVVALSDFIQTKKASIESRAASMAEIKDKPFKAKRELSQARQAPKSDQLAQIEALQLGEVEIQLLQSQVGSYQNKLTTSIQELTKAEMNSEFGGLSPEQKKNDLDAARQQYDKVKARYVDYSKQLQAHQMDVLNLQRQLGINNMFGGMGGMGGGFQ